jgi:membrane protease YdiL (CAAX protease family)
MDTALSGRTTAIDARAPFGFAQQAAVAVVCVVAGFLPLSAGYVGAGVARFAYGVLVTALLGVLALLARRNAALRKYWEIPLAFFGLALFILADRYVPHLLEANLLHDNPVAGNPYASTVAGTVLIQLVELLLTAVTELLVLWLSGTSLSSIYVRRGRFGRAYVIGIVGLIAFYVLTFRVLSRTTFMPENGTITLARYLSLTPPLLIMVAANGFLEELTFRGLLMSKLNLAFGPVLATFVQAIIFASWHVGVTYTSSALPFIVLLVFPMGLLGGYLTRSARSILPASLFHAGLDMPIYLGFLSYVS